VQSVNQHKPKLSVHHVTNATVCVLENTEVDSYLVLTLEAEDVDPGENRRVSYHFCAGEQLVQQTPEFQLDSVTRNWRTRLQTSYETLRLLTVIVDAEDDNQPPFPAGRKWRHITSDLRKILSTQVTISFIRHKYSN
jgi:hypothetical protein